MARPKKPADQKLSEHIHVLGTIADREMLADKAALAQMSEGEFLRDLIRGAEIKSGHSRTDPALIVALNRVGNNVNQLALATHRGADFVQYWNVIGEELRGVLSQALEGFDG